MNRRHLMVAIALASLPICGFPDAFAAERAELRKSGSRTKFDPF